MLTQEVVQRVHRIRNEGSSHSSIAQIILLNTTEPAWRRKSSGQLTLTCRKEIRSCAKLHESELCSAVRRYRFSSVERLVSGDVRVQFIGR